MLRTKNEIKDRTAIDDIIHRSQVCRLAMTDGMSPYVVPLCFHYDGEFLLFHCGAKGRKIDILKKNNRVCFEFDLTEGIEKAGRACGWGIAYESVIGTGTARFLTDHEEKQEALARLFTKYSGKTMPIPTENVQKTTIIQITIEELTGKHSL